MTTISLLSRNINGINQLHTRRISDIILKNKADLIVLQEVIIDQERNQFDSLHRELGYEFSHFSEVFDYSQDYGKGKLDHDPCREGLAVFSKKEISVGLQQLAIQKGIDRRPRIVQAIFYNNLYIAHTHLSKHSQTRQEQWNVLSSYDIIVGDLNMLPTEVESHIGETYHSSYNHKKYISYPNKGTSLDYCLIKKSLGNIIDVQCIEQDISDHNPIITLVEFNSSKA